MVSWGPHHREAVLGREMQHTGQRAPALTGIPNPAIVSMPSGLSPAPSPPPAPPYLQLSRGHLEGQFGHAPRCHARGRRGVNFIPDGVVVHLPISQATESQNKTDRKCPAGLQVN